MNQNEKKLMGSRIRGERKNAGLTQEELAEKLKKQRTNVANYEAGRVVPPGDVLKEMSSIFNVETDYILGVSDTRKDAIKKETNDLKEIIENANSFDGIEISEEKRQRILGFIESMFWDQKNN
ncbi:HTH-type transcriptional regulator ImmR [compost metagenome]